MPASYPLSHADAARLQKWFTQQSWAEPFTKPYTLFAFRVKGETLAWSYYPKKQSLVEEGKPGAFGAAAVAALSEFFPALTPRESGTQVPADALRKPAAYPYAGSDESGKGDTFGPLVVAACLVDERTEELLATLGVRDSKTIGDKQVAPLAESIRQALPGCFAIRSLSPVLYNKAINGVRADGGNLNTLLGQMHGDCIAELAGKNKIAWAIIDQFGDAKYLRASLPSGLPFKTEPRAEAYLAVAAGSILAREACLAWFAKEAEQGRLWPRGSSDPRIIPLLKATLRNEGAVALGKYAKLHFQSVQDVIDGKR
jgi:ribonuclease HIII